MPSAQRQIHPDLSDPVVQLRSCSNGAVGASQGQADLFDRCDTPTGRQRDHELAVDTYRGGRGWFRETALLPTHQVGRLTFERRRLTSGDNALHEFPGPVATGHARCGHGTVGPAAAAVQVAHGDVRADSGAGADRQVDHVEVWRLLVRLRGPGAMPPTGHAETSAPSVAGVPRRGESRARVLAGDRACARSTRRRTGLRGVVIRAVAFGHDDRDRDAVRVSGVGQRLAVDAGPGRDPAARHASGVEQPRHRDQSAAHRERTDRSGVLLLH